VGERRFKVWLWSPHRPFKIRGIHTATLTIAPSVIRVQPTALGRLLGLLSPVVYEYPTVVIEHVRPVGKLDVLGSRALLLPIRGRLGSAHIHRYDLDRLRAELRLAGFAIYEEVVAGLEERPIRLERANRDTFPELPDFFFE
jgi:hypothetical protein